MNFGMAAWNLDFADEWLYALGNDPEIAYYTKDNFPKHEQSNLPLIQFEDRNLPIETRVKKELQINLNLVFDKKQYIEFIYQYLNPIILFVMENREFIKLVVMVFLMVWVIH